MLSAAESFSAHHHAGGDGDPPAAVGVGHDVAVAHAEEGDGDQPHGVQEVGVLLVMIPDIGIHQSLNLFYFHYAEVKFI